MNTFDKGSIELPAFHIGSWYRSIRAYSQLDVIREVAITEDEKQYYWSADDKWYQAVNIRKIRPVHPFKYFIQWNDFIFADFDLVLVSSSVVGLKSVYRDLYVRSQGLPNRREIRVELRGCDTAEKLCEFIEKYDMAEKGH
ncbi:MAG: hypothetical protein ACOYON_11810 [Fimbriimonas sp.]